MRKLLFLLAALIFSPTIWAEDISIPTDADHPFDLTLGILEGNGMKINSANEIDNGRNGYKVTFTLDNREDADYYLLTFKAGTERNDAQFRITITAEDGTVVCDRVVPLVNNRTWTANYAYSVRTDAMKKGHYTLVFDFISEGNNYVARLADIAFMKPLGLQSGDEVEIVNPEFDEDYNGWTRLNNGNTSISDMYGNHCLKAWFWNSGTRILSQTVVGLPDGLYLMQVNAYDESEPVDDGTIQSFVFLNDRQVPMKNAIDDAVGYRNIYRLHDTNLNEYNGEYRLRADGRWYPRYNHNWNEFLPMAEHFYGNSVIATVTDGQATFGWSNLTQDRSTMIICDHFRLVYLSEIGNLKAYAQKLLQKAMSQQAREYLTSKIPQGTATLTDQQYQQLVTAVERAETSVRLCEYLNSRLSTIKSLLGNGQPHAPQAIAEANSIVNAQISAYPSEDEIIDAILHADHLQQRLELPFLDLTLANPGTLANQIEALGLQPAEVKSLKLNGTLNDEDFAMLRKFTALMEIDLSAINNTALPKSALQTTEYYQVSSRLTWVTLPPQLEDIGNSAFAYCCRLRNMKLPATLKSIGEYAFERCYNIVDAPLPEGVTIGNGVYYSTGARAAVLPASMKAVPDNLFNGCSELNSIQFNGQTEIRGSAFVGTAITELTLPEGMTTIRGTAFGGCKSLTTVTLPSTISYTYSRPFDGCSKLTELTCMAACPPYGGMFHTAKEGEGRTLRVPRFSVDAYRESLFGWDYWNIEPIADLPEKFTIYGQFTFNVPADLPASYKPDVNLDMYANYIRYFTTGGDAAELITKGSFTVEGDATFSARHYEMLYSPFDIRSAYNRGWHGPLYTSMVNNGQMRADEITVNLRLYPDCWEFLSFPYDVRVGDIRSFYGDIPLVIYGYDAAKRAEGRGGETWVQMTADSIIHAGQGYIWQTHIPSDQLASRSYLYNRFFVDALQNANKNKFFQSNDVEVTLQQHFAEFAQNRSWNFIGNPYPAFFDIRAMETTAPIIVWDYNRSYGGQYRAYSPLDDDYILFPGQAFFIQRPLDNPTLVFHKEGRQHDLQLRYEASRSLARAQAATQQRQVFNLVLSEGENPSTQLDRTRFVINEAASLDYEQARDAAKFTSLDTEAASLYIVRNGIRYAIDEQPFSDGLIPLGLKIGTEGTYTISLDTKATDSATLIDLETGTETLLTEQGYSFHAAAGTTETRFLIRLSHAATAVECVVYSQQQQPLFDLQGRRVNSSGFTLHSSLRKGLYIRNNKKVIIK